MKKNNFRLQWLPKSQGQLLCFPRTTRWDSCLTETCTDVWHPPGQLGKRQLFTHMSKTSGPPWNCQLGLFNTPTHRRLHRDQQTDSWWQPLLQIHHNVAVTKGTDTIINPTLCCSPLSLLQRKIICRQFPLQGYPGNAKWQPAHGTLPRAFH